MNVDNLEVGMVLKNYKELCKVLGISSTGGNTKKKYIKELKRYVKYHQEGYKFIIDEIYAKPKEKIDNRGLNPNSHNNALGYRTPYKELDIDEEDYDSIGVYKITSSNEIYIGSTTKGFRQRFMEHRRGETNATKDMFQNDDVKFTIVEICDELSEPEIRAKENKWIEYYKNNPKWELLNINNAWSQTQKKPRQKKIRYKTIRIKVREEDYIDTINKLAEMNLL